MDSTEEKISSYIDYLKKVYQTDKLEPNKKIVVSLVEQQKNIIMSAVNTILQLTNDEKVITYLKEQKTPLECLNFTIGDLTIVYRPNQTEKFITNHIFDDCKIVNNLIDVTLEK